MAEIIVQNERQNLSLRKCMTVDLPQIAGLYSYNVNSGDCMALSSQHGKGSQPSHSTPCCWNHRFIVYRKPTTSISHHRTYLYIIRATIVLAVLLRRHHHPAIGSYWTEENHQKHQQEHIFLQLRSLGKAYYLPYRGNKNSVSRHYK